MLISAPALNGGTVGIRNRMRTLRAGEASMFAGFEGHPSWRTSPATDPWVPVEYSAVGRVRGFDLIFH